jgi:hypothetical protein
MKKIYLIVILLAVISFPSCKKSSSVENNTTPIIGEYYFKGTLNDQALSWQGTDDFSGYVTGVGSIFTTDQKGNRTGGLTALFSAHNTTFQPQLGVEFRTYYYNYDAKDIPSYFAGFLAVGSIPLLITNTYAVNTKTLVINYTDAQGKTYNSIGAQSVTNANIVSIASVPAQFGRSESLKIKLTFSCKLYPSFTGGSTLNLTDAEATIRLEDFLR